MLGGFSLEVVLQLLLRCQQGLAHSRASWAAWSRLLSWWLSWQQSRAHADGGVARLCYCGGQDNQ